MSTVTETLAKHRAQLDYNGCVAACSCGEVFDSNDDEMTDHSEEQIAHVVTVLSETHVIVSKEKAELRYYFCGHPAWPDPLILWPPTLANARQRYEDSPHPNAWVGSCIEQQGLDVVFPKRSEGAT